MSIDSGNPGDRRARRQEGDFPPLPAWKSGAPERSGRPSEKEQAASARVPQYATAREQRSAPEFETILKAAGVVLIISALAVAAIIALTGGDERSVPATTTAGAVVLASSEAQVLTVSGTPNAESSFDERNGKLTICIDPGHGGKDMGYQRTASSAVPAMDESYFALAIAKDLEQRLLERGFQVILTRADDHEVNVNDFDANQDGVTEVGGSSNDQATHAGMLDEMQSRIDVCNDGRADLMISIHVDGSSDPAVRGSRVWFNRERSFAVENEAFSRLVYEELESQMRAVGYPWIGQGVFDTAQIADDNTHAQTQRLLIDGERSDLKEPSAMPGAVVEVLTLTSDADATFLSGHQGVATISVALDQAIIRFVEASLRETG